MTAFPIIDVAVAIAEHLCYEGAAKKVSYEWIIAIGAPRRLHLLSTERPVDHEVALGYRHSF